ncbi:MAG TPA: glycosyltransferase [Amycolatopsis sp.]|uniref:glycosyltransferase n=1 Tax=Amycolatopsis sp. TaxID=37632 RepID=UPI002B49F7D5|nr:glycosyltransferase [Amycolatopsis sp.]HKS47632.1 glycosyltransferase [Amycolatopsis sp.]
MSTYPPTLCGLASFTASLRAALPAGTAGGVVRLVESPAGPLPAGVVGELVADSAAGCRNAAALLNRYEVAIVQHEYGVYGGEDGDDVLRVLAMLSVPAVVVLHTVLTEPTAHQRAVLNEVLAAATAVVTMSETARRRLVTGYEVPAGRVHVIPHGAPDSVALLPVPHRNPRWSRQRQVLTWGLLGPGKGIEWGIEAMAVLGDLRPAPRYVVAGRTHPKVLARQGEHYRDFLASRAESLGVRDRVRFDSRYLDAGSLRRLVADTDVVLLPYDSREQVTSGVLIEAVTSRTPVVATRFPHAVELLSGGAGVLVDHQDPVSIAAAVRLVLTDSAVASGIAAAAGFAARTLGWASVAREYCRLVANLARTPAPVVA